MFKEKKKKLNLVIQIVSSAGNDRLLILGAEHFRERWLERSWEHLHKIDYNNRSAICKRIDNYPIDYSFNLPLLLSLWEFGHFSRLFHPILHESVNTADGSRKFWKISPQIPLTTRSFKFWRKIRSNQVLREVGAGRRDRKMAIQHGGGGEERGRCTTCPISTERDLSGKKRTQWNPRDRHYKAFLLPLNARHSMAHLSIYKPSQQKKHFLIPNILLT